MRNYAERNDCQFSSYNREISGVGWRGILIVPYLVCLLQGSSLHTLYTYFSCLFVCLFFSRFLLFLLQYVDLGHISEKKRAKRLGNVISNERDFSVSLETKKLFFFRLLKRQNDWKENLKVATLSLNK